MAKGCKYHDVPHASHCLLFLTSGVPCRFSKPVNVYILQVIIITNHMNGKDTHLRGMRILGPVELVRLSSYRWDVSFSSLILHFREPTPWDDPFPFVSVKFKMHEFIR